MDFPSNLTAGTTENSQDLSEREVPPYLSSKISFSSMDQGSISYYKGGSALLECRKKGNIFETK